VRAGSPMSRLSRSAAGREEQLLAEPGQAAVIAAVAAVLAAGLFAAVGDHALLIRIQRLDNAWLRLMMSGRAEPLTAIAKVFNILGLVYVTLPVRIAVAGFLAVRRQWWHLAAFTAAVAASEALIGPLKDLYDRVRPTGSLVATSGASFPSGHAVAASVTVIAAVIALVPAGRRARLTLAAVIFSILMGLSRAYLGAHWLSDAAAGILLGASCALVTAAATSQFQRRRQGSRQLPAAGPQCPVGVPPDHAGERRGPA